MTGRKRIKKSVLAKRQIVGERLDEIIRENGISQNELSRRIREKNLGEVSQTTISGIIHNTRPLQEDVASAILEVLSDNQGYRKEWLLGIDDDKTEASKIIRETTERLRKSKGTFRKIDFHPQILIVREFLSSMGFDFAFSDNKQDSKIYVAHKGKHYMMSAEALDKCLNEIMDFTNWKMHSLISNSQKID